MPQTPILALPYPAPTDPADVPTDMGELANRVEAVRGAINGLASLGADGRVPTGQLPALASIAYGTTLPASPTDGQEAILVDSVTNPTYQWRFRYNAGSTSAYKWEFVGGTPRHVIVNNDETWTTTGIWVDLTTVGPSFQVPRAGDWDVHYGAGHYHTAADSQVGTGITIADGSPLGGAGAQVTGIVPLANTGFEIDSRTMLAGLAVANEIRMRYFSQVAGTAHARWRWMFVLPRRVS